MSRVCEVNGECASWNKCCLDLFRKLHSSRCALLKGEDYSKKITSQEKEFTNFLNSLFCLKRQAKCR